MSTPIVQSKPRHPICVLFDGFLDVIIADQKLGNSYVAEAMRLEFGESVTASIMQAADIRRLRFGISGTQEATRA
jgi:hypothetical protein